MSVKDVAKQFKAAFSQESKEECGLEPAAEVLGSIHAFLAESEDGAKVSSEDNAKLVDVLLDLSQDIAQCPEKRSAGLLALAELFSPDHAPWLSRPTFVQGESLWKGLLRPALAPALAPPKDKWDSLSRNAVIAVKKLAAWLLESDAESNQCEVEKVVLQDYCDLAQSAVSSQISADKSLLQLKELLAGAARTRPKVISP